MATPTPIFFCEVMGPAFDFQKSLFRSGIRWLKLHQECTPVLCPDLSYEELEIKDGSAAQVGWNQMICLGEGSEKDALIQSLKDYCKCDSFAMVEIYRYLHIMVSQIISGS